MKVTDQIVGAAVNVLVILFVLLIVVFLAGEFIPSIKDALDNLLSKGTEDATKSVAKNATALGGALVTAVPTGVFEGLGVTEPQQQAIFSTNPSRPGASPFSAEGFDPMVWIDTLLIKLGLESPTPTSQSGDAGQWVNSYNPLATAAGVAGTVIGTAQ